MLVYCICRIYIHLWIIKHLICTLKTKPDSIDSCYFCKQHSNNKPNDNPNKYKTNRKISVIHNYSFLS